MVEVTQRDQALFHELGKYGLLTTSQISKKIFPGVQSSTVLRRLRVLEDAKWIYRVRGLDSGEMVWILSRRGESEIGIDVPMIKPNRNGLGHDVLLTDLRMQLEEVGLGQNFVPEWSIRRLTYNQRRSERGENLVPDGIFTVVIWNKNLLTVALELEVNGKNLSRYEKTFAKYMKQSSLGLVWYFVKTKSFGQALQATWREVERKRYRDDSSLVFTVLEDFQVNQRKAEIHFLSGNTNLIEQYFVLPVPAQAPAHVVGTQSESETPDEELKTAS